MNLIPRINGPIQLGNETYTFTLPLTYAGSCEAADQFPMEQSDAPVLTFENADLVDTSLLQLQVNGIGSGG